MATDIASAISAYANTANRQTRIGLAPREDGESFGDLLEKSARDAVGTLQKGEKMSALGIMGKADLTDVVQAVNNAETTLQTVSALRDKVVSAYQDVLKMSM